MDKIKQMLLNSQLSGLAKYEYDLIGFVEDINKKRIETAISTKEVAHYLIESGANALGFNTEKNLYIIEEILASDCPEDVKKIVIKSITLEQFYQLADKEQDMFLRILANNDFITTFTHLCEIGLKLEQGKDDNAIEVFLVENGNSDYLEQLLKFNPEFNLSKKYKLVGESNDITLLEVVEEQINYMSKELTGNRGSYKKSLNKILELIKNHMIVEHHNKLMEELPNKEELKNRIKM